MTQALNRARLIDDLKRDEGIRTQLYRCTAGKLTIGIGRNVEDNGISIAEAEFLCGQDVDRCCVELDSALPWWRSMSEPRQRALVNMCFNLGITKLRTFTRTLRALETGQYAAAADHALESAWAKQVGARATRIADLIRRG